jgi:glyceraldehyde 3-phosphate dehydrogenase
VHGRFPFPVKISSKGFDAGRGEVDVIAQPDPAKLPWGAMNIDIVMECSGRFTSKETAAAHLKAGGKKVIISAPADNVDLTVVYGVNHGKLTAAHEVISNASCTTNCLAPVAYILQKVAGIKHGYMTTIHSYTGDQRIVDTLHKDPRRSRAAALNMIPTSTGAARAVGLVLPELKGKLDGTAIRVPTPNVSLVDLTFVALKETSKEAINNAMIEASKGELKGVLDVVDDELVSTDFNHSPFSSNFDLTQTQVIEGTLGRVLSWYDNEWGFSNRMLDTAAVFAKLS